MNKPKNIIIVENPVVEPITEDVIDLQYYDMNVCSLGHTKSYEDYNMITDVNSKAYQLKQYYWLDDMGHYRYNENGIDYYSVAIGQYYGFVGDKFKVTLSNGSIFHIIIGDSKGTNDTINNCYQSQDGSIIEFIVDEPTIYSSYEGFRGGFQPYDFWNGNIVRMEKQI